MRVCLRLTAHVETAEELTQEAFVRAWQRLSSFRGDSAFGTWLHRLTVNVVFDEQRSRRPWFRRMTSIDDDAEVTAIEQPDPISNADHHDLESAIRRLPRGARTVFVLHDVEGWQHDEIASRGGIAVGTSKAHLHRARQLLKEWLSSMNTQRRSIRSSRGDHQRPAARDRAASAIYGRESKHESRHPEPVRARGIWHSPRASAR